MRDPAELKATAAAADAQLERMYPQRPEVPDRLAVVRSQAQAFMLEPRYAELREWLRDEVCQPRGFDRPLLAPPGGTLSEHALVRWGSRVVWDALEAVARPPQATGGDA